MKRMAFCFLALVWTTGIACADIIYVQGDVSGTWSADTVMVTGEVHVPPGETLMIEPGVEVLFQVYCKFIVDYNATLLAVGTATDSIRFDELTAGTHWHGIRFLSTSDSSRFEYCIIRHGQALGNGADGCGGGVYIYQTQGVTVAHCLVDFCRAANGGAIYASYSGLTVAHSEVRNNTVPYIAGSNYYGGGGICLAYGQAEVIGSLIEGNSTSGYIASGGGIACNSSQATITGNTLRQNITANSGGGVYAIQSDLVICENLIEANTALYGGGISCESCPDLQILNNSIRGNQTSSLYGGGIEVNGSAVGLIRENLIENNSSQYGGGISCMFNSSPLIVSNLIRFNHATSGGGAIWCRYSSAIIAGNIILSNTTDNDGAAIACQDHSQPFIQDNIILDNRATGGLVNRGGGISCFNWAEAVISRNLIKGNLADAAGGGVCSFYSEPLIKENAIMANHSTRGAGIEIDGGDSHAIIMENILSCNATIQGTYGNGGGGIGVALANPLIVNNLIFGNADAIAQHGGSLYYTSSSPLLINCVFWANTPQQIYHGWGDSAQVSYSDIQGFWPGLGNINAYPAFVDTAHDDYRLLWGSPCIDSGDPNPIYDDPDSTRCDMGAFYYDQSKPVRVLLTPHHIPYLIPATGGWMDYTIRAFNRDSLAHGTSIWCDVTMPDSSIHGPVLGPVRVTLGAWALLERVRTQNIPAAAPMGVYHYNAYAVVEPDTSKDSFMFGKLGDSGQAGMTAAGGWQNTGEPITDVGGALNSGAMNRAPTRFALHPCSPNPFNATTAIRFELRAASFVNIAVYDVSGRLVETIVSGWRQAGTHEVTFDGPDLPSGIYICRLQAGEFEAVQKMVLLK